MAVSLYCFCGRDVGGFSIVGFREFIFFYFRFWCLFICMCCIVWDVVEVFSRVIV